MDSIEVSFGEEISRADAEKYRGIVVEKVGDKVDNVSDLEEHGNFGFYVDLFEDELNDIEAQILDCLPDGIDVGTRQTYF